MEFPYRVSQSLIDEFSQRGFVVTPSVLRDEEIARYGKAVDEEVERRTAHDRRKVADKSTYEQSFVQCMRLWETNPKILPLSCDARMAGIAAQLLQVPAVRMWQDQALYKEAGGRKTTPHQDQAFWPIGDEPLASAWIPFDDVTLDSGAMAYVPGSHRVGRLRVVDITHRTEPYHILADSALAGTPPEWVEATAGDVVWHHGMTVHMAAANETAKTRRVFTIVYISSKARRHKSWHTFPLDREGIEVGEIIAGPGLPELWPAAGKAPQPACRNWNGGGATARPARII